MAYAIATSAATIAAFACIVRTAQRHEKGRLYRQLAFILLTYTILILVIGMTIPR